MICVCGTKPCKLKMVSDILDHPVHVPNCHFSFLQLGFPGGNFFLIAPFPDHCLLVPFCKIVFRAKCFSNITCIYHDKNRKYSIKYTWFYCTMERSIL